MRSLPRLSLLALGASMVLGLAPSIDVGGAFDETAKTSPDPIVVELGKHRFGETREPQAVVAHAAPGDGPAQVGIACPAEGECSMPPSFDVVADGTVWVTDAVNRRLLAWTPGRSDRPSRTISLGFSPADLAFATDGTIYVTGVRPGIDKSMQLFALDMKGREAWRSAMPTEEFSFNSHIRMGPGGILYGAFYGSDGSVSWAPAIDDDGRPLVPAEQLRLAKPAQPLAGGRRLAVTGQMEPGHDAPTEWEVVLSGKSGATERTWRIIAEDDIGLSLQAEPTIVDGDPVVVFEVYRYEDHVMEHVVLRLSPTGLVDRLSLPRGAYRGALTVTDIRIGGNGRLYQLHTHPNTGMVVDRYRLAGGPTPTPKPNAAPTIGPIASPTAAPSPTPTPIASPTTTPSAPAGSTEPSGVPAIAPPTTPGDSDLLSTPIAVALGALAVLLTVAAFVMWRTRSKAAMRLR